MGRGRPRKERSVAGVLPRGRLNISALEKEYTIKLDRLARKWGCETLSEAALEILKDGIDEEVER